MKPWYWYRGPVHQLQGERLIFTGAYFRMGAHTQNKVIKMGSYIHGGCIFIIILTNSAEYCVQEKFYCQRLWRWRSGSTVMEKKERDFQVHRGNLLSWFPVKASSRFSYPTALYHTQLSLTRPGSNKLQFLFRLPWLPWLQQLLVPRKIAKTSYSYCSFL